MPRVDLCLNMIVKDEAEVIYDCLSSARHLTNWWCIVDTGSTDGTQEIIREFFERNQIPGELHERPWVSFEHNRNEALDLARQSPLHIENGDPQYALFIDADEQFTFPRERVPPTSYEILEPRPDGAYVTCTYGNVRYQRLAFARLDRPWRWKGVVHEVLELPGASLVHLPAPGLEVRIDVQSARSKDPDTYRKDAELLTTAVIEDPDDTRSRFYLAQSLRDAGMHEQAKNVYQARAEMGGWVQEKWYAQFQVGVMAEWTGAPRAEVMDAYLSAFEILPDRAEALVAFAQYERGLGNLNSAFMYARRALDCPDPQPDWLFVDQHAYDLARYDEVASVAFHVGEYQVGRDAAIAALAISPNYPMPPANLDRLQANLRAYEEHFGYEVENDDA